RTKTSRRQNDAAARRLLLQIVPCAKGPPSGPGDDGNPLVAIALESAKCFVELDMCRRMQRIHRLGTVDGDDGCAAVLLDLDEIRHALPPWKSPFSAVPYGSLRPGE